jgi:predicted outer membrane repeat protein
MGGVKTIIGRFSCSINNLGRYSKDNLLIFGLILFGLMVIFSYGMGNVSAVSGDSIYVNSSSGNDAYNGLNSTWISGLNGPKATIKNATGTVTTNGTVYISRGTYNESNIQINTNMKIMGENQANTIINGKQSGNNIFTIATGVNLTIINLTLTNATSNYGAIFNNGTLTVDKSTFTNNNATNQGGAIFNNDGCNLTVNNSTFIKNTASSDGGAIGNFGTLTVDNSTFTGNTATYGGAIISGGILTVNNSTFINNTASYYAGAIFNYGTGVVNFNRIIGNSAPHGSAIYNLGKTLDARYNWWGSNADPSTYVSGPGVTFYDPWILLAPTTITVNPINGYKGDKINLTANLTDIPSNVPLSGKTVQFSVNGNIVGTTVTDNNGIATLPYTIIQNTGIYTILAEFTGDTTYAATSNTNTLKVSNILTVKVNPNGGVYNTTKSVTLTMNELGNIYYTTNGATPTNTSNLYTGPITIKSTTTLKYLAMDLMGNKSTIYSATYTIDKKTPTANANIKSGLYNTNKVVKLTMNKKGTIYYTLNRTTPTINSKKYNGPITIKSTTTLKYLAVDLAGNKSPIYTNKYTIDKTALKVISAKPKNNSSGVSLTTVITIKFNEKINKTTKFSKIHIKNLTTGKITHTTTKLSGNTITIKMIRSRLSLNHYQVIIPNSAIKDITGNTNKKYTINFKTRRY